MRKLLATGIALSKARTQFVSLVVLITTVVTGCSNDGFEKPPTVVVNTNLGSQSTPSKREFISGAELKDYVSVIVENGDEAERYTVQFSWPKLEANKKVRIRDEKILAVVQNNQTTFSHVVNHNQIVNYIFEVLAPAGEVELKFNQKVTIPRDFVVREGNNQLINDQTVKANRIYLSGVPLITNGHKILIETNELHSSGGRVDTFAEGAKAPNDTEGRSAGELQIKAKVAIGELKVFMRGQNGGDGTGGSPLGKAAQGYPGTPGNQEEFCPESVLLSSNEIMRRCSRSCVSTGSPSGNGANGAQGTQGNPAKNGGDTGYFKISVDDAKEFSVKPFRVEGLPGNPGLGGPGQEGGEPGVPASPCSGGVGGKGATGPQGAQGLPARSGKKETACVYLASEQENYCEN